MGVEPKLSLQRL